MILKVLYLNLQNFNKIKKKETKKNIYLLKQKVLEILIVIKIIDYINKNYNFIYLFAILYINYNILNNI